MAIERNGECFTYFAHFENGEVFPRRLHRLVVRDSKGNEFVLKGKQLPDAIITSSGNGHKGKHTGHVLLGKEPSKFFTRVDRNEGSWPNIHDLLQISIGIFVFSLFDYLMIRMGY